MTINQRERVGQRTIGGIYQVGGHEEAQPSLLAVAYLNCLVSSNKQSNCSGTLFKEAHRQLRCKDERRSVFSITSGKMSQRREQKPCCCPKYDYGTVVMVSIDFRPASYVEMQLPGQCYCRRCLLAALHAFNSRTKKTIPTSNRKRPIRPRMGSP